MIHKFQMYTGGQWTDSASGKTFPSINPSTGQAWAEFPEAGPEDVDRAVSAARQAFEGPWGKMLPSERGRLSEATKPAATDGKAAWRPFGSTRR